ncbi:MAG: AsnC family protein [Tepidiformaceae bacterium]
MAIEPAELGELPTAHHIPGLVDGDQRILAARCWGCSNSELAPIVGLTPEVVRRRFERIEDIILGPTGLKRDLAIATQWFNRHLDCERQCLAHAKMLIEKGIVYGIG